MTYLLSYEVFLKEYLTQNLCEKVKLLWCLHLFNSYLKLFLFIRFSVLHHTIFQAFGMYSKPIYVTLGSGGRRQVTLHGLEIQEN